MQPYFFPYLGYFELIARTDCWVVLDTVQYAPQTWMNRNRILDPNGGWKYVTVPVKRHRAHAAIREIEIHDRSAAERRIFGQLQHYRGMGAPNFSAVLDIVRTAFSQSPGPLLRDLSVSSLAVVCQYLGITFEPIVLSQSGLMLPPMESPGDWSLEIATALGATAYLNPPNGRDLFEPSDWLERGIRLGFTELIDFVYEPGANAFVDYLSILDVLMWNAPETIVAFFRARDQAMA